jgi:hypothetical protein
METILNNVATFLFMLHPFFMYKVHKVQSGHYVNFSYFITISLLILPPLWLLLNWQLANMLLVLFILGTYYLFKGVLDDVNEIRKSK